MRGGFFIGHILLCVWKILVNLTLVNKKERMKKFVVGLICLWWLGIAAVWAQNGRIEGTVIDRFTRQPLELVNVIVVGLPQGSSTDAEGKFVIEQIPPGIYRLQASFLGYKTVYTEEYRVNHLTPHIQIEMEEEGTV